MLSPVELDEIGQLVPSTVQRNFVRSPPIHKSSLLRILSPSRQQNNMIPYRLSLAGGPTSVLSRNTLRCLAPKNYENFSSLLTFSSQKLIPRKPFSFRGTSQSQLQECNLTAMVQTQTRTIIRAPHVPLRWTWEDSRTILCWVLLL